MKTVMVIDGALNCAYDCYQVTDENYFLIFPGEDQDIEFIEDVWERLGRKRAEHLFSQVWARRLDRRSVNGIHGLIFAGLDEKREFYPNKKDSDLDGKGRPL